MTTGPDPRQAPTAGPRLSDRLWRLGLVVAYRMLRVWWFVRRPDGRGVHVAVWCHGELLLIRNSYRPGVTVPSGGIGRQESPLEAATRELREEVGITVSPEALEPAAEFVVPFESKSDHGYFFELRFDAPPDVRIDQREVVWSAFVPVAEIAGLPISPHLRKYLEQLPAER